MTDKSDSNGDLGSKIKQYRREFLAGLGGLATMGTVASMDGEEQTDTGLQAGGLVNPLTQQYRRDHYVTAPASALDPSVLESGEFFWTQGGRLGVQTDDGPSELPVGSSEHPVPSVTTEELNSRIRTVGPDAGNKYQSLDAAFNDITDASRTNHYTLLLTGDLTGSNKEDSHIDAKSHISVIGNGHRVEVDDPDFGVQVTGINDARWENLTIDHNPSSATSYTAAVQFEKATDSDVVFHNVRAIGQDQGNGGGGFGVIDNAAPHLIDCVGVGGDGGDASSGLTMDHGCTPTVEGGIFYGGNGGLNCYGVAMANGSPAPTMRAVTGVGGQTKQDCFGISVKEGAAPQMEGCVGRPKIYPQFFTATGSGSDVVDSGNPLDKYPSPESTTGWPSVLLGIEIRILTAASGATIDIGTTSGGSEIAANIDASSTQRIAPSYTQQRFLSGDKIYVTPSDASVEYNLRYILAVDQSSPGMLLDTHGEAVVSGGTFISGTRAEAVRVGSNSKTSRNFSVSGATCRPIDPSRQAGMASPSSDGNVYSEIRDATLHGGTSNLLVPGATVLDTTSTFAGGGTQQFTVSGVSPGQALSVSAQPNSDPANDVGFAVDKVWWDDSVGTVKVQVSETEAAGGGTARVTATLAEV